MRSANLLVESGLSKKEDIFRKLKFSIEQQAAFTLWEDYTRESSYRNGFENGKESIRSTMRELLNVPRAEPESANM